MKTQTNRMLTMILVVGASLFLALPVSAAGRSRGGVIVGPAFGPWGWYGPYGPYPYGFSVPNAGEVKLDTNVKDAEVFINGAYAGAAGKLKSMWMLPAAYDIEIRAPGRTQYKDRIYVVAGKTLQLYTQISALKRNLELRASERGVVLRQGGIHSLAGGSSSEGLQFHELRASETLKLTASCRRLWKETL
jgi:hypothetical protein